MRDGTSMSSSTVQSRMMSGFRMNNKANNHMTYRDVKTKVTDVGIQQCKLLEFDLYLLSLDIIGRSVIMVCVWVCVCDVRDGERHRWGRKGGRELADYTKTKYHFCTWTGRVLSTRRGPWGTSENFYPWKSLQRNKSYLFRNKLLRCRMSNLGTSQPLF